MNSQDILTPLQIDVLKVLYQDEWFRENFYLTGGTALSAFYLFHRYSDDLDFFSHDVPLDGIESITRTLEKKLNKKIKQVQKAPQFLRYQVDGDLQLDFVGDIAYRVGSPKLIDSFMVDNLKNIAVNKVGAILGRVDPKDYVDLYFLLTDKGFDINELLILGANKDSGLEPFIWASLIEVAENMSILPRMIRPLEIDRLREFYATLRTEIIDSLQP